MKVSLIYSLFVLFFCGCSLAYGVEARSDGDLMGDEYSCLIYKDFKDFFAKYIADDSFRKSHAESKIEVISLDIQLADKENPYRKSIVNNEALTLSLEGWAKESFVIDWVKPEMAKASLFSKNDSSYQKSFVFERFSGCWKVVAVVENSIPLPEVLPQKEMLKSESCLESAKKFEEIAERTSDVYEPAKFYDRALYAYICAAQNGSSIGAFKAAQLGASGQSRLLPTNYIEKLLLQASDEIPEGMGALAEFKCGGSSPCKDPDQSYFYIKRAVVAGDRNSMNLLGAWFERGMLGEKDISRALGCYELAAKKGDQRAASNYQRLKKISAEISSIKCVE